ncbi:MAG: acetylxylan esterase, partial [Planctomycetes bacterium]|nr:acetylxylan esterase [Planctomycetota bacterium]
MLPSHTDESQVPDYDLPELLRFENGTAVESIDDWQLRRQEIIELYKEHIFGRAPEAVPVRAQEISSCSVFDETVLRREIDLILERNGARCVLRLLIYVPISDKPQPLFMGLNFNGNHSVDDDAGIDLCSSWVDNVEKIGVTENVACDASRGTASGRWNSQAVCARGYAVATIARSDVDPDFDDDFQN